MRNYYPGELRAGFALSLSLSDGVDPVSKGRVSARSLREEATRRSRRARTAAGFRRRNSRHRYYYSGSRRPWQPGNLVVTGAWGSDLKPFQGLGPRNTNLTRARNRQESHSYAKQAGNKIREERRNPRGRFRSASPQAYRDSGPTRGVWARAWCMGRGLRALSPL